MKSNVQYPLLLIFLCFINPILCQKNTHFQKNDVQEKVVTTSGKGINSIDQNTHSPTILQEENCCVQYDNADFSETLIKTFYPFAYNFTAPQGSQTIMLDAVPASDIFGNSYGTTPIRRGDLLLVIQMQGAAFDSRNQREYGDGTGTSGPDKEGGTGYTDIGQTGLYEYVIALNDVHKNT